MIAEARSWRQSIYEHNYHLQGRLSVVESENGNLGALWVNTKPTAIFFGHSGARKASLEAEMILRNYCELLFVRTFDFSDQKSFDQSPLAELQADFLFSFGPLLVREPLLSSLKMASINFHPAPPRWPGRGSCSMALFEGDIEFGVTAHLMKKEIDAGSILRVVKFDISKSDNEDSLRQKSFNQIPALVDLVLRDLWQNQWQPQPNGMNWQRKALKKAEVNAITRTFSAVS